MKNQEALYIYQGLEREAALNGIPQPDETSLTRKYSPL